jgi:hypothetical protein
MTMTRAPTPSRRTDRRTALRTFGVGAAAAGGALMLGRAPGTARAEAGQHLAGTWLVSAAPGAPARLLVSFTVDGLALRTAPLLLAAPPALGVAKMFISTTHGEWVRSGDHAFALTFYGFAFDEGGTFLATQRIRVAPVLSETLDTFSGPFTTEFLAAEGHILATTTGMVEGTRIRVEPPDA